MNNGDVFYDLTEAQKRIWHTQMMYPNSSMFQIGGTVLMKGEVKKDILQKAITLFLSSHSSFSIRIVEKKNKYVQYFSNEAERVIKFYDFSQYEKPKDEYKKWCERHFRELFILHDGPLYELSIFQIGSCQFGYMIKIHHVIADGWSIQLLTDQILSIYERLVQGKEEILLEHSSYEDFIDSEQKYLNSNRYQKDRVFFQQLLKNVKKPYMKQSVYLEGNRKTYYFSGAETKEMNHFCTEHNISVNTLLTSLYIIYLYKTTKRNDLVIGIPVLGRYCKSDRAVVGMFSNTLPFRFILDEKDSFIKVVKRVYHELGQCYKHQRYPYNHLLQSMDGTSIEDRYQFDGYINYYNTSIKLGLGVISIENTELYNGEQDYPIQMIVRDWSDGSRLQIDFDYKIALYQDSEIENRFRCIKFLMKQVISDYELIISALSLLSSEEKEKLLLEYNNLNPYEKLYCSVIEKIREQAQKNPNRIALKFEDQKMTYRQLEDKTNDLGAYLQTLGLKKEEIVGLYMSHSLEAVIGMIAILKAGGAYLPMERNYPGERILFMLKDCGCKIILCNVNLPKEINFVGEVINLASELAGLKPAPGTFCAAENSPHDLAYIIYTSGSTGKPKGVMIEHHSLWNYLCAARKNYVKELDVFALYSPLSFDLTITSIFTPLISGGRLNIYQDNNEDSEYLLHRIIKERDVTVLKLTPSHMILLEELPDEPYSIKTLIVGGENLTVSLAERIYQLFRGNADIYNEYGPTEATVGCMVHKYDPIVDRGVSVPIGRPIEHVQIYILDEDKNPVAIHMQGEIYISGENVGRGYLNRPELTSEKFTENPFIKCRKMYRTGDKGIFTE